MKLSVMVPADQAADELRTCPAAAIQGSTFRPHEVIVVGAGSS